MGLGPSSTSWMAQESTYEGTIAFPDCVPRGTTVEAGGSIAGVDSSSKTQRRRTLELGIKNWPATSTHLCSTNFVGKMDWVLLLRLGKW